MDPPSPVLPQLNLEGSSADPVRKRKFSRTPLVQRKRAATACQFCRLRKTKCDNVRPVCGFCRYHQAKCVYSDSQPDEGPGPVTGATVEENHKQLLTRLDRIEELLQFLPENNERSERENRRIRATPRPGVATPLPPILSYPPPQPTLSDSSSSSSLAQEPSPNKTRIFFSPSTKCEAPLKWPIFKGFLDERYALIDSFLLEPPILEAYDVRDTPRSDFITSPASASSASRSGARQSLAGNSLVGHGIRDEALVPLCRKFLAQVHTKNPIIEGSHLMAYATECAEHGLKWDASSCLVLLACALACYTQPWTPPVNYASTPDSIDISHVPNTESPEDCDAAAAYFLAATKRIGLLESSLLDIQCLFFASIYEKYAFRTLQSWFYLQQAATRLRVNHLQRGATSVDTHYHDPDQHRLEERIFWAIFKAESDMLPELQLSPTDLQQFDSPNGFPSPPESLTSDTQLNPPVAETALQRHEEERSWFFYLAELSLRRTINDVLPVFYGKGEDHWMADIDLICRQYDESNKQMSLWTSCLPSSIHFNDLQQPTNELVSYLQGRLEEWREWITRPLLYYCLHHEPDAPPTPRILRLARQEVKICAALIGRVKHHRRHGGTWLLLRRSWRCAIIILAVVIRDGEVEPPKNWKELVQTSLVTLARWSPGLEDIQSMRIVLGALFRVVLERFGAETLL